MERFTLLEGLKRLVDCLNNLHFTYESVYEVV